jgi:predicted metal-dependent phosphoesterase TrpH
MNWLRADLHVHTCHSRQSGDFRFLRSRDCYSRPEEVYRVAKSRGMDLVAITDHDTLDGALELLDHLPGARDVIVGEEVSCRLPDGNVNVHLGVYGMTEALHRDLQPLRCNVFEVTACLREAGVFFALNHLLLFYRGQTRLESYLQLLHEVPAVEARNGAMLRSHNLLMEEMATQWKSPPKSGSRLAMVGGSDAHTLRRIGLTWTEAPGRNREEFLESLKNGRGRAGGRHGAVTAVAGDTYGVIRRYVASLAGFGPRDHGRWHRAGCMAFVAASLPFQFLPLAIALVGKARETHAVSRTRAAMERLQSGALDLPRPIEGDA